MSRRAASRPPRRRALAGALAAALSLSGPAAPAQQAQPRPQDPGEAPAQEAEVPFSGLPPAIRLGVRAESVRRQLAVVPTLLVVSDPEDFIEAVGAWSVEVRFPVLIDDGTDQAREDIARFVRAFEPKQILTWAPPGQENEQADAPEEATPTLRQRAEAALASAWGAPSADRLAARWSEIRLSPPGVIVASANDPAWPAALALGAGRGQPILWVDPVEGAPGDELKDEQLAQLHDAIEQGLTKAGFAWREIGDAIDAVTLCLNMPTRWRQRQGERRGPRAVTDRIGRFDDDRRFAWTGLIPGTEAQAAYRAMCALFVQPRRAWLFDGYPPRGEFARYDMSAAVDFLEERGFQVTLDDAPGARVDRWRNRASAGVNAGLIMVNTRGGRRRFRLLGDWAQGNDVPQLNRPALVHFIHSFSAQDPGDAHSIANRWLAMGAFAYVGAVHEPFLTAFHPPRQFALRMSAPAPLAAAALQDEAPTWRVLVVGDPLFAFGPPSPRLDVELEPPGAVTLEAHMRQALADGDLAAGAAALIMLGRDADAARLYRAAVDGGDADLEAVENADAVRPSPELVRVMIPALVRTGDADLLIDAAKRLGPGFAWTPTLENLLWHGLRGRMERGDEDALAVMQDHVRQASYVTDVLALGEAAGRIYGVSARDAVIRSFTERAPDEQARRKLTNQIGK